MAAQYPLHRRVSCSLEPKPKAPLLQRIQAHLPTLRSVGVVAAWMGLVSFVWVEVALAEGPAAPARRKAWALAIHGGAGTLPKNISAEEKAAYVFDLAEALGIGRQMLDEGASALDVVEVVVKKLEDSPLFNAGKGAVFTHDGDNQLDAAIMDGRQLACGAVAGVRTVKNPISLARAVMEKSPHVFMVGTGAEAFAASLGIPKVDPSYFRTERRWQQLQDALAQEKAKQQASLDPAQDPAAHAEDAKTRYGTVGAVALDRAGNLAAATSTGGMTNKRWGRVGDAPIIGAGTYANNQTVAVSCTGWGEKFIRQNVAHTVSALVEFKGLSVQAAADEVIKNRLEKDDGGLIAVGRDGSLALVFNSEGMYRGSADSHGHFEVAIWDQSEKP